MLEATSALSAFIGSYPRYPCPKKVSMPPVFFVEALVEGLAEDAGFGLLGEAGRELVGGAGDLVAKLEEVRVAVRIQRAGLDRRAHRAAGFAIVAAIAEAALLGQRLDVGEVLLDILLARQLQLAHARRVDQAGARRQR